MAKEQARRAEAAGADGVLLFPPYLVTAPPSGVVSYCEAVADAASLPLVVYQRDGVRLSPEGIVTLARHPQVIGLKDGLGDLDHLQRLVLAVRGTGHEEFTFFNGMPTAEMSVMAYRGIGIHLYSSAAFAFIPEVATAFHGAVGVDHELTTRLLRDFYSPLAQLRDQVAGYAVSLVKAGVRLQGLDVGCVRPPLVDVTAEHLAKLSTIIGAGLRVIGH